MRPAIAKKLCSPALYSGLYRRAVVIAETVKGTPEKPHSTSSSRQTHRTNAEADKAEAYFRRNVFYPFVDHISSKIERPMARF